MEPIQQPEHQVTQPIIQPLVARRPSLPSNPLVRIAGKATPANLVWQQVVQQATLPIQARPPLSAEAADESLIDPTLAVEMAQDIAVEEQRVPPGTGYAAFTPRQRAALLSWLDQPTAAAPAAFQQLYLAHLEVDLFVAFTASSSQVPPITSPQILAELTQLQSAPAWQQQLALPRLRLLAYWLMQDGPGLANWQSEGLVPASLLGIALGMQALLQCALQSEQLPLLFHQWSLAQRSVTQGPEGSTAPALFALRLSSLNSTLGEDVLAYALAQLGEAAHQVQPWRASHRALRFALPQPNLRPVLEPLLRELVVPEDPGHKSTTHDDSGAANNGGVPASRAAAGPVIDEPDEPAAKESWRLILEFGESRAYSFEQVLRLARRQKGYVALMDEDRKLIHRVYFRRGELPRFWRLWDYVQSWSNTRVYLDGEEINKWDLYTRLSQAR